jgi:hypothetical protein
MKDGTRWRIRLLMLLPIVITPLNNHLLIIDNPRDRYVIHAAAAVVTPRQVTTDPVLPKKQEILTLLKKANSWQLAHPVMKSVVRPARLAIAANRIQSYSAFLTSGLSFRFSKEPLNWRPRFLGLAKRDSSSK